MNSNFMQCIHFCDISFIPSNTNHSDYDSKKQKIDELIKKLKDKKYGL